MWLPFIKKNKTNIVIPRIAKVKIHPIICQSCHKPLNNGDLSFWLETEEGRDKGLYHAYCMVFIEHQDLSLTTLDGTPISNDQLPQHACIVSESHWEGFKNGSSNANIKVRLLC